MKIIISILLLLIGVSSSFGQKKVPLNQVKLKPATAKKINSIPVASIVKGKFILNKKALNAYMPNKAKIESFSIKHIKEHKVYFLKRTWKVEEGESVKMVHYLQLRISGNKLYVDMNSKNADSDCKNTDCADCGEYASGSGTMVCACGSETGSCVNAGSAVIGGTENILEKLFE